MIESKLYELAEKASSFLLLNLIWIVVCVPLITFVPATAALFRVVQVWHESDDFRIFPLFFEELRQQLRTGLILTPVWLLAGIIIVANYRAISTMPEFARIIFYSLNSFAGLVYLAVSLYIFPVLARYQLPAVQTVKLAFVLSHQRLWTTLQCAVVVVTVLVITLNLPFTILISGSLTAYVIYWMCSRTFPDGDLITLQPRN